jgi:putative hydrolase of the HAD superfamily
LIVIGDPLQAVLFDFFGTLVTYEPDRSRLAYPDSHRLLRRWGCDLSHESFVKQWDAASNGLQRASARSMREFSMLDAARAFAATSGLDLSGAQCHDLATTFVVEWQRHVRPVTGVADLLARLAGSYRLGVVSNTQDPAMVPSMLRQMGVAHHLDIVVLSVVHGYRKPHRSIYTAALESLGVAAADTAFVGDSYEADYLGPRAAGMTPFLIDPEDAHGVPRARRLPALAHLEDCLGS